MSEQLYPKASWRIRDGQTCSKVDLASLRSRSRPPPREKREAPSSTTALEVWGVAVVSREGAGVDPFDHHRREEGKKGRGKGRLTWNESHAGLVLRTSKTFLSAP
jgi:hypothetical protein